MRQHSRAHERHARRLRARDSLQLSDAPGGFLAAWNRVVDAERLPGVPRRRGRKPRVPVTQVLPALTFHVMPGAGTLAEHFDELFGDALADSSWSDRRRRLPWAICADLMRHALRPKATRRHREAFWHGWRLVGLDGTPFSLTNTPQIRQAVPKARSRRGRAAVAKLSASVLVELGVHNPIAAAIGRPGESAWALGLRLLVQLPKGAWLLADRLYGCAAFAEHALTTCTRVGSHVLLRARRDLIAQTIKRLPDGSRWVRVPVRAQGAGGRIRRWIELREIRVRVGRPGHRGQPLRLWTSLRDWHTAPALDLARLYASRWEHEGWLTALMRPRPPSPTDCRACREAVGERSPVNAASPDPCRFECNRPEPAIVVEHVGVGVDDGVRRVAKCRIVGHDHARARYPPRLPHEGEQAVHRLHLFKQSALAGVRVRKQR